ncbi:putative nucleotide-binding alpha-beta plait domain superfamily, RNA-binding domain superfamily [Septoria linicola]|nr:putative nucleotide-binding alpha-beta plait domain superfamily, RNA-binding domain superfamily [Septoria linicola]
MTTTEARTRLHITPFNPSLLDRYVPPAVQPLATNISYHTVETFPERGFGYVELPESEAQKLRKKLNGMMLKGTKVKIEEAKPERKRRGREEEPVQDEDDRKARKKAKKEKRKAGELVLEGHELPKGRHIKRGWGEDKVKSRKSSKKDDGIKDKKMMFKTVVPPNKIEVEKDGAKKSRTKEKKELEEKKSGRKEVVVTEGKKSSRPAAGGNGRKSELRYEEGQGWVDEDGEVVEAETEKQKRKRERKEAKKTAKKAVKQSEPEVQQDSVMEEAPELDSEPEDEGTTIEIAHAGLPTREAWSGDEDTASSPTVSSVSSVSSDSESEEASEAESASEPESDADTEAGLDKQLAEAQSNTVSNKNTQTPEATSLPVGEVQTKEVHPLEALFKRPAPKADQSPKPKPTPIDTSFSFFDAGGDIDGDDVGATAEIRIPQTPRTKEDLAWRGQRSAAPTPDTAAIGKKFDFSFAGQDHEEEEDEDEDMVDAEVAQARAGAAVGEQEESEFRKWFYENRGALNRGWKKRRKEERKSLRQRENRKVGRRIA